MKVLNKIILLSLGASLVSGSGFKIPEQSGDSVAMAASNVAASFSADAAYYNPANMVFMPVHHEIGFSQQYLRLGSLNFKNESTRFGNQNYDTSSKVGHFYVPGLNVISPFITENIRFGMSLSVPAGMTMRWDDPYPKSIAEIFQIQVLELAPSIAYMINDQLSIAVGPRAVYSTGKAKNEVKNAQIGVSTPYGVVDGDLSARREMEGNSWDFGYNAALAYRPTENLSLAATYRSKVNMTLKGDASIRSTFNTTSTNPAAPVVRGELEGTYNGDVSIDIPLPAILTLGTAYSWDNLTLSFAYDRTFWSSLKEFDFEYSRKVPVSDMFDKPVDKQWHDTDTFRFGVVYQYSDQLRLMGGFAIDEPAADSDKVRFELPDTKSYIYSLGSNYKFTPALDLTAAALYQDRQKRQINARDEHAFNNLEGTFGRTNIWILNLTLGYRF
nr:transporter [Campylobacter sp.]